MDEDLTADVVVWDGPYGTRRRDLGYDDGRVTGEWADYLRPRLEATRAVMARTGVLLAFVDEEHHAHLRLLLDEVFGSRGHLGTVVLDGATTPTARFLSSGHEYVLAYARSVDRLIADGTRWREPRPGAAEVLAAGHAAVAARPGDDEAAEAALKAWWAGLPRSHPARVKGLLDYNKIRDGHVVRWGPLAKAHPHVAFRYEVLHPVTGRPVVPPPNGWRWTRERMAAEIAAGRVEFGRDETTPPRAVLRLVDTATAPPPSVIRARRGAGARRLASQVPGAAFVYPKDPDVLARMLSWCLPADGTILDPFAGSGSTLDAVVSLNERDAGARRCVLVESDAETVKRVLLPRAAALGAQVTIG